MILFIATAAAFVVVAMCAGQISNDGDRRFALTLLAIGWVLFATFHGGT